MKRFRVLQRVLRDSGANRIWLAFLVLFFACAAMIQIREPNIKTYGEALWYCYAVVTTIGFGDVVVQYKISRILSVVLSISAAVVIALVTGVIVNFFIQITSIRQKETLTALMDKLEHLPELSPEELEEISLRVRAYRND